MAYLNFLGAQASWLSLEWREIIADSACVRLQSTCINWSSFVVHMILNFRCMLATTDSQMEEERKVKCLHDHNNVITFMLYDHNNVMTFMYLLLHSCVVCCGLLYWLGYYLCHSQSHYHVSSSISSPPAYILSSDFFTWSPRSKAVQRTCCHRRSQDLESSESTRNLVRQHFGTDTWYLELINEVH